MHIAFSIDTREWCFAYMIVDSIFLIDLILNFFTTISQMESSDEVTDRKAIIYAYLSEWFFIDLLSILPIEMMATGAMCPACDHH